MLDFPELFAPARMVSGLMSIDCRCAIDLYPQTLIRVKPCEFPDALGFLDPAWWFILDRLYKNLYYEASRKMQVYISTRPAHAWSKLTPGRELSDSINARQSSGSGIALLVRHGPKLEQNLQALLWRKPTVIVACCGIRLTKCLEFADHQLHGFIIFRLAGGTRVIVGGEMPCEIPS